MHHCAKFELNRSKRNAIICADVHMHLAISHHFSYYIFLPSKGEPEVYRQYKTLIYTLLNS